MKPRILLSIIATVVILFGAFCPAQQTASQKRDTALMPPPNLKSKLAPNYAIPTVDISEEKQRQVIVDREPGQFPRMLWCCWRLLDQKAERVEQPR